MFKIISEHDFPRRTCGNLGPWHCQSSANLSPEPEFEMLGEDLLLRQLKNIALTKRQIDVCRAVGKPQANESWRPGGVQE